MLMLAMSRSPGSAFVVAIDISLRAEFIVSSRIVLDWMESMVVSSMPFGGALVISTVGMLVLPVAAWDGWILMVSGISGSGFLLSFGVSSRMMPSQILIVRVIFKAQFHSEKMSFPRDLPVDTIQQNFGHRDLCPGVHSLIDLSNGTAVLRKAFIKLEAFHNQGGNIKALEIYLNSHIDETLKHHQYKFLPEDSDKPLPDNQSISETIIDLSRKNDVHKRGGYDQREWPGSFLKDNKRVEAPSFFEVMEPTTAERWDVGLGPIFGDLCKSVDTITLKLRRRGCDDKFMCSYNDLFALNKKETNKYICLRSMSMKLHP